ncbi:MAG: TRAP transporter substrate-binding protein DctP [Pseudomonadota bacterium]
MKRILISATALAMLTASTASAFATEWNVSLWGKRRAFTEHVHKLKELVEAKTDGKFKLNIAYGTLSGPKDNLDGISIGAFEMAQFCAGYHAHKNRSITVLELPFLGITSLEQEAAVSKAVYAHQAVVEEMAAWDAILLMPTPLPQYNVIGTGEPPRKLSDYEGMTVRATGGIGEAMKAIGAVPTSTSAAEVRQAMDSGVVKAVSFAPHAHMSFGTVENATWWTTNLNPGTLNCPVVVNSDAIGDLSPQEREALLGSVDEAMEHYITYYNENTMNKWEPLLDEKGVERITYNPADLKEFRDKVAGPAAEKWVQKNGSRLPAQELLDLVKSEIAKEN